MLLLLDANSSGVSISSLTAYTERERWAFREQRIRDENQRLASEIDSVSQGIQSAEISWRRCGRDHRRACRAALAMAFAIASGLSPQAGIYTAIIAGFLISALGGSSTQIGAPPGPLYGVYGIAARHGLDGLYICTLMGRAARDTRVTGLVRR